MKSTTHNLKNLQILVDEGEQEEQNETRGPATFGNFPSGFLQNARVDLSRVGEEEQKIRKLYLQLQNKTMCAVSLASWKDFFDTLDEIWKKWNRGDYKYTRHVNNSEFRQIWYLGVIVFILGIVGGVFIVYSVLIIILLYGVNFAINNNIKKIREDSKIRSLVCVGLCLIKFFVIFYRNRRNFLYSMFIREVDISGVTTGVLFVFFLENTFGLYSITIQSIYYAIAVHFPNSYLFERRFYIFPYIWHVCTIWQYVCVTYFWLKFLVLSQKSKYSVYILYVNHVLWIIIFGLVNWVGLVDIFYRSYRLFTFSKYRNMNEVGEVFEKQEDETLLCTVCQGEHTEYLMLKCKHKFGKVCIRNWCREKICQFQSPNCPLCRKKILINKGTIQAFQGQRSWSLILCMKLVKWIGQIRSSSERQ